MTTAGGPTVPGTTSRGSSYLKVTIMSVNGPIAVVIDQTGRQMQVRRDLMRAKGYLPQPTEQWLIDKSVNNMWYFALCLSAVNSVDTDVAALQTNVSGLQTSMATVQAEIPPLQTAVSNRLAVCTSTLAVAQSISASVDTYAANNWVAFDPESMVFLSLSTGVSSYVTIPVSGRYHVYYCPVMAAVSGAVFGAFITKNAASFANSIARDTRNNVVIGNTRPQAYREVTLLAGDKLYWGVYCSSATTLLTSDLNVPTELEIRYVGSQ